MGACSGAALCWYGKLQLGGFLALFPGEFGRWRYGVADRRSGLDNAKTSGLVRADRYCRLCRHADRRASPRSLGRMVRAACAAPMAIFGKDAAGARTGPRRCSDRANALSPASDLSDSGYFKGKKQVIYIQERLFALNRKVSTSNLGIAAIDKRLRNASLFA